MTIIVSGASGNLGRRVLELLVERVDAAGVVALTRTPDKVADLGVATRVADFNDPDGLATALDGGDRFLLISTGEVGFDGIRVRQHTNAVEAAKKAGVGHVFYTSVVRATDAGNPSGVAVDHGATERALAASGLPYTSLRNNIYTDMLLLGAPAAVATGVLSDSNGDGATGYVTREDCAAVAATLLAEGGDPGQLLDVTGPEAVTHARVAELLTEITGKPVRYQPVTDAEFTDALVTYTGAPEPIARFFATLNTAAREGYVDVVSDVVERVTGRKPTPVDEFLAANRAALLG